MPFCILTTGIGANKQAIASCRLYPCHLLRRCDSQIKSVRSKVSDQKSQINKIFVVNLFIGEIAADIVYIIYWMQKCHINKCQIDNNYCCKPFYWGNCIWYHLHILANSNSDLIEAFLRSAGEFSMPKKSFQIAEINKSIVPIITYCSKCLL